MKKRLTENITKYDDKIRLRMDGKTFLAALISLVCALLVFIPVNAVSFIAAVTVSPAVFVVSFMLQISKIDSLPLYKYISTVFSMTFNKSKQSKLYTHGGGDVDGFRITVKEEFYEKEGQASENKEKTNV